MSQESALAAAAYSERAAEQTARAVCAALPQYICKDKTGGILKETSRLDYARAAVMWAGGTIIDRHDWLRSVRRQYRG